MHAARARRALHVHEHNPTDGHVTWYVSQSVCLSVYCMAALFKKTAERIVALFGLEKHCSHSIRPLRNYFVLLLYELYYLAATIEKTIKQLHYRHRC